MKVGQTRIDGYVSLMQFLMTISEWHSIAAETADIRPLYFFSQHGYATKPSPSRPYMTLTATSGRRPKVVIGNLPVEPLPKPLAPEYLQTQL